GEADGWAPVGFHADRVDDAVCSPAQGAFPQLRADLIREVVGFDSVPFGHRSALRYRVDGEHVGAPALGDAARELPHRAEPHDDGGVAGLDARILDALPRGRQDVAEEQVALVGQVPAHHDGVGVGQLDAQEFGLAAGDLPVQLGVAVEAGARSL